MNSKRWAVFGALCGCLLFTGCDLNNGILRRAAKEYFPLPIGAEWTYRYPDLSTSKIQVRGDSVAYNYPCLVVEQDFQKQYWIKSEGELRKFVDTVINIGGTDYPLEQRFRRYYVLPFVLGDTWAEEFRDAVPVMGETIAFEHRIRGKVVADTVIRVPAGEFAPCYEVDITETWINGDTTTDIIQEWYAPGVGLVKRIQGSVEEELQDYQFP